MVIATNPVGRLGVVGWPVAHSRSPLIHGHWLAEHGLPGRYELLPTAPDDLGDLVAALRSGEFIGCNITVPHKVNVAALLRVGDELQASAQAIGAVNTLVALPNARLRAINTDALGYLHNLQQTSPHWRAESGPATVLGAGGAARAVVFALAEASSPELRIANRSIDKAQQLCTQMAAQFPATRFVAIGWDQREAALLDAQLLVNTTDLGMLGQAPLDINLSPLPDTCVVSDIVYAPLITPLLKAAKSRGLHTSDGLGMLLHQASAAFEAWFGIRPTVSEALRAKVEATLTV